MFAIASILTRYVEEAIDRRAAIAKVNGLISDVRLKTIMKAGKLNVATCITQETVRQWEISQDYQVQAAQIGAHQEIPNPDDSEIEPTGNEMPEGLTDSDEFQVQAPEIDADEEPVDSGYSPTGDADSDEYLRELGNEDPS